AGDEPARDQRVAVVGVDDVGTSPPALAGGERPVVGEDDRARQPVDGVEEPGERGAAQRRPGVGTGGARAGPGTLVGKRALAGRWAVGTRGGARREECPYAPEGSLEPRDPGDEPRFAQPDELHPVRQSLG